jgi:hypothetical protein
MQVFAVDLLVRHPSATLRTRAVDQEKKKIGFDALDVGNGGIYGVCGFAIVAEEAETFGIAW